MEAIHLNQSKTNNKKVGKPLDKEETVNNILSPKTSSKVSLHQELMNTRNKLLTILVTKYH